MPEKVRTFALMLTKLDIIHICLKVALVILVFIRVFAMVYFAMSGIDSPGGLYYFLFRQAVYTMAWISLLVFVSAMVSMDYDSAKQKITMLKKCAFWAMILCGAKFIVLLVYVISYGSDLLITLANNIIEVLVWFLLTGFFYFFWQWKKKEESEMTDDDL